MASEKKGLVSVDLTWGPWCHRRRVARGSGVQRSSDLCGTRVLRGGERGPVEDKHISAQGTPACVGTVTPGLSENGRILLANLLQSSRSTFSRGSFLSFFAFQEGRLGTSISVLGGWPTVSARYRYTRREGHFSQHGTHRNSVHQSTSSWWVACKFLDSMRTESPRSRTLAPTPCVTENIGNLGKLRQLLLLKAWHTHGNTPHGGVDFYQLLALVRNSTIQRKIR
jgi:hypothetical protein